MEILLIVVGEKRFAIKKSWKTLYREKSGH
jgi:hypothetical protein